MLRYSLTSVTAALRQARRAGLTFQGWGNESFRRENLCRPRRCCIIAVQGGAVFALVHCPKMSALLECAKSLARRVNIKETIAIINRMQADQVIERYAIGGAVGATFYLEPVATLDLDVFITLRVDPASSLLSLQPIFDYLKAQGATVQGEYIVVAGWPVQFLPTGTPLLEEALEHSIQQDVDGILTRVFTAEHLAAIALQTGRAKDKTRLLHFLETGALDQGRFQAILGRHGLVEAWHKFERQFLTDRP
jgi:hypothetical protein